MRTLEQIYYDIEKENKMQYFITNIENAKYDDFVKDKECHYTYLISGQKKYIGVRSSKIKPKNDIGIKYFSSSSDKGFIKDQKNNPSDYIYSVIEEFVDRYDANCHEIFLHMFYDVGKNQEFYNKVKQTSVNFDVKGCGFNKGKNNPMFGVISPFLGKHHSHESKKLIAKANKGRKHTVKSRNNMGNSHKGKKLSQKHKDNLSLSHVGRIQIHKDNEQKQIKPNEVNYYLYIGWVRGPRKRGNV